MTDKDTLVRVVAQYDARIREGKKLITESNVELSRLKKLKKDAQIKLEALENKEKLRPRVSDHAVIRYLERKAGFTFDDVREKILTPDVIASIESGAITHSFDGMELKIRDKCVTTII